MPRAKSSSRPSSPSSVRSARSTSSSSRKSVKSVRSREYAPIASSVEEFFGKDRKGTREDGSKRPVTRVEAAAQLRSMEHAIKVAINNLKNLASGLCRSPTKRVMIGASEFSMADYRAHASAVSKAVSYMASFSRHALGVNFKKSSEGSRKMSEGTPKPVYLVEYLAAFEDMARAIDKKSSGNKAMKLVDEMRKTSHDITVDGESFGVFMSKHNYVAYLILTYIRLNMKYDERENSKGRNVRYYSVTDIENALQSAPEDMFTDVESGDMISVSSRMAANSKYDKESPTESEVANLRKQEALFDELKTNLQK